MSRRQVHLVITLMVLASLIGLLVLKHVPDGESDRTPDTYLDTDVQGIATFFAFEGGRWRPVPYSGLQKLCSEVPTHCELSGASYVSDEVLVAAIRTYVAVNRAARWEQVTDGELWSLSKNRTGGIDDWALHMRSSLIEVGIPSGALRFAILGDDLQDPHISLLIETKRGPWLLDRAYPVKPVQTVKTKGRMFVQSPMWATGFAPANN